MTRPVRSPWRRSWQALRVRPRLVIATATGLATLGLLPTDWAASPVTRALVSWNLGVVLYLVLAFFFNTTVLALAINIAAGLL